MDRDQLAPETSTTVPPPDPAAALAHDREVLMRQVLASRTFARSARLSQFFEYVCRKTIEGRSDQINEQQIGVHVFGRSPAYSAGDDSIVRTQARLLRQRLEEYFEHECPACPVVVLIPKGGYVPIFERRVQGGNAFAGVAPADGTAADPLPAGVPEGSGAGAVSPRQGSIADPAQPGPAPGFASGLSNGAAGNTAGGRRVGDAAGAGLLREPAGGNSRELGSAPRTASLATRLWMGGAAIAILLLVAVILAAPLHLLPGSRPSLWTSIFTSGRPVVIVPSDDGLVLSEELRQAPVTLDEYLSGTYLRGPAATEAAAGTASGKNERLVTSAWLASHQYTSTADLGLAMRLNRLPEAESAQVETRYARALHLDDLKSRNVILIGGIGANPWVGLFSPVLNFDVNYDWKTEQGYVINKDPKPGEPARYNEQKGTGGASSYGVLAYLPGVSGIGSALLFEGSGMAGTEAAADFPFSGEGFASFLHRIAGSSRDAIPYFEVLLETRSVGGDAPEPKVVAWRIIPR